jgi:uncharacterized protein YggE
MKRNYLKLVLSLALVVALSGCCTVFASAASDPVHRATVTGRAVVTADADTAQIIFAIESSAPTVGEAQAESDAVWEAVEKLCREGERLTECGVSISACTGTEDTTVWMSRSAELLTTPDAVSERSRELLSCGVSNLCGVRYSLSDDTAVRERALEAAIQDAKAKLAALGLADTVTEVRERDCPPHFENFCGSTKQLTVTAAVTLTCSAAAPRAHASA